VQLKRKGGTKTEWKIACPFKEQSRVIEGGRPKDGQGASSQWGECRKKWAQENNVLHRDPLQKGGTGEKRPLVRNVSAQVKPRSKGFPWEKIGCQKGSPRI